MKKIKFNQIAARSIFDDIDDLNRRDNWSIYYMYDLERYINMAHNHLETLLIWRDTGEDIEPDEYSKIEQYIEIASNLERALDIAIIKLRCGNDVCIDYEY